MVWGNLSAADMEDISTIDGNIIVPQMHLDTALRNEPHRGVLLGNSVSRRYARDIREGRWIVNKLKKDGIKVSSSVDISKQTMVVLTTLERDHIPYRLPGDMTFHDKINLACKIATDQAKACGIDPPTFHLKDNTLDQDDQTRRALEMIVIDTAKMQTSGPETLSRHKMGDVYSSFKGTVRLQMGKYMGYVTCVGTTYLVSRDQMTLLLDLITQRLHAKIMCQLAMSGRVTKEYPKLDTLMAVINWGDNIVTTLGNAGYKIIKEFENIVIGEILRRSEDIIWDCFKYRKSIRKIVMAAIKEVKADQDKVLSIYDILEDPALNVHHLGQLFGLFRIWGHPWVDVKAGCIKLMKRAKKLKIVNNRVAIDVASQFKEMFCLAYKSKHGVYPSNNSDELDNNNLLIDCLQSNRVIDVRSPLYHIEDWREVQLNKIFECEETFNLATMINDKAISLNRDELIESLRRGDGVGNSRTRRMILKWLESDMVNAKELLESIDKEGLSDDELAIGKCPKEREMGYIPRLFSLLPLKMRMYFVVTESLLAEDILQYLPQITMVDDELTLMKKIYQCNKNLNPSEDSKFIDFVLNIDFEKWNSNMREAASKPLFKIIDGLYGFNNCMSRTHEFFQRSFMYLGDGSWWPERNMRVSKSSETVLTMTGEGTGLEERIVRNPYSSKDGFSWTNHLGGLEGLRQKGWTIFTICAIALSMKVENISPVIMGQGDNQVVICSFRRRPLEEFKAFKERILGSFNKCKTSMYQLFNELRLPIKESETWSSTCVFAYGKRLFYKSVQLSMTTKKCCRLFSFSNEGIPSLDTSISTIYANCVGACMVGYNKILPYIMCVFSAAGCLNAHFTGSLLYSRGELTRSLKWNSPSRRIKMTMSNSRTLEDIMSSRQNTLYYLLLTFPSVLGGLPISLLSSMIMRGFPDPLTEATSLLIKLVDVNPSVEPYVSAWLSPIYNSSDDPTGIIEDPLSVNLDRPTLPAIMLKRECQTALKNRIQVSNTYMKTFLTLSLMDDGDYKRMLCSIRPMWPRLAQDIYDSTLWGVVKSIIGRVVNTRTVQAMSIYSSPRDLKKMIKESSMNYIRGTIDLSLRSDRAGAKNKCGREVAEELRTESWKLGRLVGVTVPHTVEYMLRCPVDMGGCQICFREKSGYILLKHSEQFRINEDICYSQMGPCHPYLGSVTKEKISGHEDKTIINTEPLVDRVIKLQRVVGWFVDVNSKLEQVISDCLKSVTDLESSILYTKGDQVTGSEEHRYRTFGSSGGGFIVGASNPYTHMHISTNTWSEYSKGSKNYVLDFQATMCWCQVINFEILSSGSEVTPSVHYHQSCNRCIISTSEDPVDVTTSDLIKPPSDKENPMCWVPKERIMIGISGRSKGLKPVVWDDSLGEDLLYYSVGISIVEQMYRCSNTVLYRALGLDFKTLPISWVVKLQPDALLEFVTSILIVSNLYAKVNISPGSPDQIDYYWGEALLEIANLPLTSFDPLLNLLSSDFSRRRLMERYPDVDPPDSSPVKISSGLKFIRSLIVHISRGITPDEVLSRIPIKIAVTSSHSTLSPCAMCCFIRDQEDSGTVLNTKLFKRFLKTSPEASEHMNNPPLLSKKMRGSTPELSITFDNYDSVLVSSLDFMVKSLEDNSMFIAEAGAITMPRGGSVSHLTIGPLVLEKISEETLGKERVNLSSMIFRVGTQITTAYYKWLGIFRANEYEFMRYHRFACVGDGVGGVSALISRLSPRSKIFYNTLIDLGDIIPQSLGGFVPPALEGMRINMSRMIGYPSSIEGITDITDPNFPLFAANACRDLDLICCDAEGDGWEGSKGYLIIRNLMRLASLTSCNHLIIKLFGANTSALFRQLSLAKAHCDRASLMWSEFSSLSSTEIFLDVIGNIKYPQDSYDPSRYPDNWTEILHQIEEHKERNNGPDWNTVIEYTCSLDPGLEKLKDSIYKNYMVQISMPPGCLYERWFEFYLKDIRRRTSPIFINKIWEKQRSRLQFFDSPMQSFLLSRFFTVLFPNNVDVSMIDYFLNLLNTTYMIFYETADLYWGAYWSSFPLDCKGCVCKQMTIRLDRPAMKNMIRMIGGLKILGMLEGTGSLSYSYIKKEVRPGVIYVSKRKRPANIEVKDHMSVSYISVSPLQSINSELPDVPWDSHDPG